METPIDFVSVFPDDFEGSPNVTVTPDGRRFTPRARSLDGLDLFDESLISSHSHHGDSFVSEVPEFAETAFREVPSPDLSRKPSQVPVPTLANIPLVTLTSSSQDNGQGLSFFPAEAKSGDSLAVSGQEEAGGEPFAQFSPSETQIVSQFEQKVGEVVRPGETVEHVAKLTSEEEEKNSSFRVDFNKAFNPGFNKFGEFGGQSAASVLWGEQKD